MRKGVNEMKRYYMLTKNEETKEATINIFGDITSYPWLESDVSSYNLSKQLAEMGDVDKINVFISSYGGEVKEGLEIYHALKRHKANVVTYCESFACSIASVIFLAGDERIMSNASLLMIHNAWTWAEGNAEQLRKQADDLEKITQASVEVYKENSKLSEEEIKALLDQEKWISPEEALEYGFATAIEKKESNKANQNALQKLFEILRAHKEAEDEEEEPKDDGEEKPTEPTDTDGETDETENDDENGEGAETEGEENTDGGEDDPEEEPNEETQKNATQKWSGFFNAILRD